ncbi:uncharacterized protein LOC135964036 [Calliphora vicina]|uniref:uncharacterized protein LOC135964036 n=1 Tax=Calliphora vicina TaxID=7373 RepID=UPI00325B9179
MVKSQKLITFERTAAIFLDFEKEYNDLPTETLNSYLLDIRKEEFKTLWDKTRNTYEDFATQDNNEVSEEDFQNAKELFKNCRLGYISCAAQMGELSDSFFNKSGMSSTQYGGRNTVEISSGQRHNLKLPPCITEVFKGDYQSWPSFRDMFKAVYIDGADLSGVEKLCYLRQFTEDDALLIVKESPLTNEGFLTAWENLRDRYENKRILVHDQLKILFNLVSVKSESGNDIKRLQRDINNCISTLRVYKINIESWDPIFVYACLTKLPFHTLSLWEQTVKSKMEIPLWKELDEFLTGRFHSLETINNIRSANKTDSNNKSDKSNNSKHRNTSVRVYQTKVSGKSCPICATNHALKDCRKFLSKDQAGRFLIVKNQKLCINCLNEGHKMSECKSKFNCSKCQLKHHTLLHKEVTNPVLNSSNQNMDDVPSTSQGIVRVQNNTVQNCFVTTSRQILLATAVVNIVCQGETFTARALIDPASQSSFICEKIQRKLDLPTEKVDSNISALNCAPAGSSHKQCNFVLGSRIDRSFRLKMSGLVLPRLTGNLPNRSVDNSLLLSSPFNMDLADPNFTESGPIDILIGGDFYPKVMLGRSKHNVYGNLMAQESVFGWILTGPIEDRHPRSFTTVISCYTEVNLYKQLENFWKLEEPPKISKFTSEDDYCEEFFKKTTKRNSEGRFIVSLPFKPQYLVDNNLGSSREKAKRQFLRNEISLQKNPELKAIYDGTLSEYEELGHMNQVDSNYSDESNTYYLPHHAVFKPESTSTKVRVVFNASSRTSTGLSLNDILYTGPVLQNDLMLLIIRWRFYRFVFNGDIEKMYRQILLDPEHANFQRIVFRRNPQDDLKDYELKTVTFGINCAPFSAIRTLHQLADDVEEKWPLASKILRDMMYVDDALVGAHDVIMAIKARDQIIAALLSAGFSMRKWTSNNEKILEGLPSDHLLHEKFLEIDDTSTTKTLGVRWNAKTDHFYFSTLPIALKDSYTKREVLSTIARLFDPAGWLGPIVVIAKILMQQIWSDKTDWDEVLSECSGTKWRQFLLDYVHIDDIKIPRWVGFKPSVNLEFHGFSDASEKAYGACVYARIQDENGIIQSHLVLAKSKVAPLKTVYLPRLELCGALLLAELLKAIGKDLKFDGTNTKFYTWTDSMIVLAWLQKPPSSWTTFVANRVAKITEYTSKECWRHVASCDNPADLLSRGVCPQELVNNRIWWHGPSFLCSNSSQWNIQIGTNFETREEQKNHKVFFTYSKSYYDLIEKFSSFTKALRIMALVMRAIQRMRGFSHSNLSSEELTADELNTAKIKLIIMAQKVAFGDEYHKLENKESVKCGNILNLNPFLDEKGIMRVGGRLANALELSYNEKFPILLPSNCRFSVLLVDFIHKVTLHGGNQLMLRVLRTQFYIVRARNLIKTIISRCRMCALYRKKVQSQIMAALPTNRTIISRPFTTTGVDFAGPFDIRNFTGRACLITKGYVCLFVCFATKAIHLEAVSNLSTPAFLAAFSRFVARRGCPRDMYSDNGTNFVGASKVLKIEFREFLRNASSELNTHYGLQGVNWKFNPASAPHMGGLWEAGVKSFKYHFRRIAGNIKYTFEEFSTLLARIESCLNSRPLCPLIDDVECLDILTPGHFLIGAPLLAPPEPEITESPISITNRWQRVRALNQRLCSRWKDEYLKDLQKRNKWKFMEKNLEVGDMVVIREDNLPPNEWRLGRVHKLHIGKDGHTRVVELKTVRGIITRPVVKLVALPTY